ncbi:MAG TPA: transglutaminase domain-containing protein [Acidimicrobiales bacterium]|nr:transglutaminase domain-containing protein [Acidimicrobiales bacterium]
MTLLEDRTGPTTEETEADVAPIIEGRLAAADAARIGGSGGGETPRPEVGETLPPLAGQLRSALAAGLSTAAVGLVVGGIFGSWAARGLGLAAAAIGAGWALLSARSSRATAMQAAMPVVLLVVSAALLITAPGGPGSMLDAVREAIAAGRAIRPPVPFDPGWRVLIVMVVGMLGFGAASVALGANAPKLGIVLPLPFLGLASVTQPESEQLLAGVFAFVPVLAAIAVLYGGDLDQTRDLGSAFELKRLVRGLLAAVPLVGVLLALGSANFLFPDPVFDPDDKPQKPRAAPLSADQDRVLFEVSSGAPFTGPWRTGALDVYEDDSFLIAGFDRHRLVDLDRTGIVSKIRTSATQNRVTITVRDIGNSAVVPILGGTTQVESDGDLVLDPRTTTLRVPTGRAPAGLVYTLSVPGYASESELADAVAGSGPSLALQRAVPPPPPGVQALLDQSPTNPWKRLDFLRTKLLGAVTAKGVGAPIPVARARVEEMLAGKGTATPFEIVAAEALLARWAGVPSRVGFGFDGVNAEEVGGVSVSTVRPRNAAQWLEVWFDGYGWVPLVGSPAKAEASLDTDPNARFDPGIEPSDDVAVEVYLPFELEDLTQLYQRIRDRVAQALPAVVLLASAWIGWPFGAKVIRRSRRRRWATAHDARTRVAVEYAELRDFAIDLGVGDIYDTPLEYLSKVRDDREHAELAWLASRALYGDLRTDLTDADVLAAEELSASVRRRLAEAQPLQVRLLAHVSRASIDQPYTTEVPNIVRLRVPFVATARARVRAAPRAWQRRWRRRRRPLARIGSAR